MNRVLVPHGIALPAVRPATRRIDAFGGATMGTTWSVKLLCPPALSPDALRRRSQAELDRVVLQMSSWRPDSDLSRFNAAPAGSWHCLPDDFFQVLDCAAGLAEQAGGAYDPTVGPLVNLWGFGPRPIGAPYRSAPPAADEIQLARARCGWRRLTIDRAGRRIRQPGGIALDLSAIAKGYGVDCIARSLRRAGVEAFLVEVGGELRGEGLKADGAPWWVALETPAGGDGSISPIVLALHGLSVATAGDYRRFFDVDGVRYAHTIDPRTGWPAAGDLASVTVVHPSCMQADAISTLLSVLGPEGGMAYARRHRVPARFVTRTAGGFAEQLSPALDAMLD